VLPDFLPAAELTGYPSGDFYEWKTHLEEFTMFVAFWQALF